MGVIKSALKAHADNKLEKTTQRYRDAAHYGSDSQKSKAYGKMRQARVSAGRYLPDSRNGHFMDAVSKTGSPAALGPLHSNEVTSLVEDMHRNMDKKNGS
jgi:hypothetical protein